MLYTDTDIISYDDLQTLDSNVSSVVSSNSIQVGIWGGHIEAAQMEVGELILADMQSFADTWFDAGVTGLSWNRYDNAPLPRLRIGQIVVDDTWTTFWSPIKRVVACKALIKIYTDASGRMKDDIYDKKVQQWEKAFRHEWSIVKRQGIPIVYSPVPAPAAKYEPNSGTWDWDGLGITTVPCPGAVGGAFSYAITYQRGPTESYFVGGPASRVGANPGEAMAFDISTLNPPPATNQQSFGSVDHWNIYLAPVGKTLFLQARVPITTTSYALSGDPGNGLLANQVVNNFQQSPGVFDVLDRVPLGRGQARDTTLTMISGFYRG